MKSALLVLLLAAAATAAVVSNEVPEVPEVPDVDEVADVDLNKIPEVLVIDEDELTDADVDELTDEFEGPAPTAVATRRNLNRGSIGPKDVRVFNRRYRANCLPGRYHVTTIRINTKRPITAIRVNRVGATQRATPSIRGGGIGKYFVIIRIQSAVSRGYDYRIQVYRR